MMKGILFCFVAFCLIFFTARLEMGYIYSLPTRDRASLQKERVYMEALEMLQNGSARQKLKAVLLLGSTKNPRFIRPLMEELKRGIKKDNSFSGDVMNDPHIKTSLAWALGRIAHPDSVPSLLEVLEQSIQRARQERKMTRNQSEKALASPQKRDQRDISQDEIRVVLDPDRPGPYIKEQRGFVYNPDMMWSLSYKLTYDLPRHSSAQNLHILSQGANYWNLVRSILLALGRIGGEEARQELVARLDAEKYPVVVVRSYAARALGEMNEPEALQELLKRFPKENDPFVRVHMLYSILQKDKTQSDMYLRLLKFLKNDYTPLRLLAVRALKELAMGESLEALREAYRTEAELHVRRVLRAAIINAERDNIFHVIY